jgi:sugar porter (SP) family MFS transporter
MNKLLLWSIISSLAGFLFGFDTVVASGVEKTIQALWDLSPKAHGLVMGSALYGTVIGSLVGGWPTEKFGRKKTLFGIGILYIIAAVGTALTPKISSFGLSIPPEAVSFTIARFLGGLGIGISTVAAPLYISEIAPPARRGLLAGMFQFNIVFGILIAFASNALIKGSGPNDWRWMLGVAALPSLIYTVLAVTIPESPRWLISHKGDLTGGMKVLKLITPEASDAEIRETAGQIESHGAAAKKAGGSFWSARLAKPIMLAFLIAFFNQLSGVNAILYFAPRIFEMTGLGEKSAMLQSVGIGVTNLIFTFVGLWLTDRLGRRTLMYIGSFGYIASLGLVAWAFFTVHYAIVPVCIFAFIASHAVGQGTVIWVFISEVFPNEHRATGQALGSFTHWIFAAAIATVFPIVAGDEKHHSMVSNPGYIFAFFAGMMVLQLVWVKLMMPETKGLALEDLEGQLTMKH